LPVAAFGDSARLALGETVLAIGHPVGVDGGPTVTVGVVSGLGRWMEDPGLPTLFHLIQTDAAINPGNSGGPLVNLAGQVVGINTALVPSAQGISFAISINSAKPVLSALVASRRVTRPSLGLAAVTVAPQVNDGDGFPERGVLVLRVEPGGPADSAGLMAGDVITALGGRAVRTLRDLHDLLSHRRIGDGVDMTIWREGQNLSLRAVLGEQA
jgi:serine protease Do